MALHFELSFPCFIVRRDDESRFAVVERPTGEKAIAILTDPRLAEMFVFEHCFERTTYRPLPINTPLGLARILARYLPPEVTHVVFNPNGAQPRTETVETVIRLLKHSPVGVDADEI
jgi:hypothetical protein